MMGTSMPCRRCCWKWRKLQSRPLSIELGRVGLPRWGVFKLCGGGSDQRELLYSFISEDQ